MLARGRSGVPQLHPHGCMIAGLFPPPDVAVDLCIHKPCGQLWTQQKMIDPEPGIAPERVPEIVPEGIDRLARVNGSQCVGPPLLDETGICSTHLGGEERVVEPSLRFVDIQLGRHDVEVADEHHRQASPNQLIRMTDEPVEPAKFVIELLPRPRIAVGQVEAPDQNPVDCRLNITALAVVVRARQPSACFMDLTATAEDGDPIPAFLAMLDRSVAQLLERLFRKLIVGCLQLLEAHDIGSRFRQPPRENRQASVNAVHIVGRDLHRQGAQAAEASALGCSRIVAMAVRPLDLAILAVDL